MGSTTKEFRYSSKIAAHVAHGYIIHFDLRRDRVVVSVGVRSRTIVVVDKVELTTGKVCMPRRG